jgi:hypothetical protein
VQSEMRSTAVERQQQQQQRLEQQRTAPGTTSVVFKKDTMISGSALEADQRGTWFLLQPGLGQTIRKEKLHVGRAAS